MTPHAPKLPPDYYQRITALSFNMMTLDAKLSGREAYLLAKDKVNAWWEQMSLSLTENSGLKKRIRTLDGKIASIEVFHGSGSIVFTNPELGTK